ncbi:hypothetical protein SAMN04488103_11618 [Gemmobacter aquatilis]|uniref:Uncharacterized protein n=1 Tax=Gemmobacter aquatilis TaxID=933059 RepID=A0A1H8N2I9_9RHOB|nr:hypothetical protein [Gemmobacter aquatilis]SEO23827.1 hypothetical protein SAMN04488103_11618 [Gemmobacter aquatilis]
MYITLSPIRMDTTLSLHRAGDVLTINGTDYDFTPLAEGAVLPRAAVACPWLASDVTREGGVIRLTLILPHGAEAGPARLHPAPLDLTGDGPVLLPADGPEETAQ